jgi:hypothetical protein
MEIQFTDHRVHPFKVYSWVVFSIFTKLRVHQSAFSSFLSLSSPEKKFILISSHSSSPPAQHPASGNCSSRFAYYGYLISAQSYNMWYFANGFHLMFSGFIYLLLYINTSFPFMCEYWVDSITFAYPFINWWAFALFLLFWHNE